jgi:hypothetical protein
MPADDRADILRAALRVLAKLQQQPPDVFSVTVRSEGVETVFTARPGEFQVGRETLTSRQQAVLECFRGQETLQAKQIAQRTGYRCNSALRQALAEMVQLGLIAAAEDGYRRA